MRGRCDRYISKMPLTRNNIMDFLDVDNEEGDILLYQNVSAFNSNLAEGIWTKRR